jgi:hypothetical protein
MQEENLKGHFVKIIIFNKFFLISEIKTKSQAEQEKNINIAHRVWQQNEAQ